MTFGIGSGPKNIQLESATFGAINGTTTLYTCPSDTYSIIMPIALFGTNGSGENQIFTSLSIRITNPAAGGNYDQLLGFPNKSSTSASAVLTMDSATIVTTPTNPSQILARFLDAINPSPYGGSTSTNTVVYANKFLMYPGESLIGSFNVIHSSTNKFTFGLLEFGVSG